MRRLLAVAIAACIAAPAAAAEPYHPSTTFQGRHAGHHHDHPDLRRVSADRRRNGRALLRTMQRVARTRFPTVAAAERLGYREGPRAAFVGMERASVRSPFVHYRSMRYDRDGRVLDPARPEALVYWRRPRGEPVLVGFMFRASALRPPPDPHGVGSLLNWHAHAACDPRRERGNPLQFRASHCPSGIAHHGETQMTHVWLANGLRAGFAGAVPARDLGILIEGAGAGGHAGRGRGGHHHHGGHHHQGGRHHHAVQVSAAQATVANAWAVSLLIPLAALLLIARGPGRQAALRLLGILLLAGIAVAHAEDLGAHVRAAPYLAALFCLLIAACALLAVALAVGWRPRAAWAAAVLTAAGAIAAFVASRTLGLPQIGDHVGEWGEPAAVAALTCEAAVAAVGVIALRAQPRRHAVRRGASAISAPRG